MSIKRIAEMTGTSISTVSRVLNNPEYKCSSEELKKKIWDAARRINYVPNASARSLKMGKNIPTETSQIKVGALITRVDVEKTDPFFMELTYSIEKALLEKACKLEKIWYNSAFSNDKNISDIDMDTIVAEMREECPDIQGLIVVGKCNIDAMAILRDRFGDIIAISRNSSNFLVDEVICDGRKLAMQAIDYLVGLGHKKIGYVGPCFNEVRYHGYLETMKAHNIEPQLGYVMDCFQSEEDGYRVMGEISEVDDRPSAIYTANDIIALGMIRYLKEHKKSGYAPSIISSDGITRAEKSNPRLTTVKIPKKDMASLAVSLLLDRIEKGHENVTKLEMLGNLEVGESCYTIREDNWYGVWN
ncbi:MAG: LacI family transcriptional regulator [Eubacterium sp.]|nr:LacI family transcriptional regulator [Eubacterium sp.]